jgi:hypothetical protein
MQKVGIAVSFARSSKRFGHFVSFLEREWGQAST